MRVSCHKSGGSTQTLFFMYLPGSMCQTDNWKKLLVGAEIIRTLTICPSQMPHLLAPSLHHRECMSANNQGLQVASKRTSKRFSTFSGVPSLAASDSTSHTNSSSSNSDPRLQEIKEWTQGFDRLEQKRLQQQRYQPTPEKTDSLSKLALGAKVERALGRRMTDQDATFRPKLMDEKAGMGRSVTTAL